MISCPTLARPRAACPWRVHAAVLLAAALAGCSLFSAPEPAGHGDLVAHAHPPPAPGTPAPAAPVTTTTAPAPVASVTGPASVAAPEVGQPLPPGPPVSTRHYKLGPATSALVGQAQAASAKGDYLTAMSTLERAAHIEPRNPLVWIEISKVRLASAQPEQAESVARKAVALSEGDYRTSSEAWKQVALALKAQNRNPEAASAEARANRAFSEGDVSR